MSDPEFISLAACDERILVSPGDDQVRSWVLSNFGAMVSEESSGNDTALTLRVQRKDSSFEISRTGGTAVRADSPADLIYRLEKIITIELQKRRSDLLVLHAAAVEWRGKAIVLAGNTGAGKSTTTWALLQHGFGYLSDELCPIDLNSLQVVPYPHAICLKQRPKPPYAPPPSALDLGRTLHVPAQALPSTVITRPIDLGAVFLLQYDAAAVQPVVTPLTPAAGAARLYVTALNALAHSDAGLAAVLRIAEAVPCFSITTAGLAESCQTIRSTVERLRTCLPSSS